MKTNNTHGFGTLALLVVLALLLGGTAAVFTQRAPTESTVPSMTNAKSVAGGDGEVTGARSSEEATNKVAPVQDDVSMMPPVEREDVPEDTVPTMQGTTSDTPMPEVITLAGGCFWCIEAYLQEAPGVLDAVSGYAVGDASTETYTQVSTGKTKHREAVQVTYDTTKISTEEVLDVFWSHIDPTDTGGQFADRGMQYTTAIFYANEEQHQVALDSKMRLETSGLFDKPIATKILPFTTFFPAEEYHQDYYKKAAAHYEAYKKASGRAGFVEDTWAKDAALLFLQGEQSAGTTTSGVSGWVDPHYTKEEVQALQKKLDANAYHIVAEDGTEPAYQNAYWDNHEAGIYVDVVTGRPLFSSTHKYDSHTGWPSFWQPIREDAVTYVTDTSNGMVRTEVRSEGGHLGHLFNDGPTEHGGKRYCMNSGALRFVPKEDMTAQGYSAWLYLFGA